MQQSRGSIQHTRGVAVQDMRRSRTYYPRACIATSCEQHYRDDQTIMLLQQNVLEHIGTTLDTHACGSFSVNQTLHQLASLLLVHFQIMPNWPFRGCHLQAKGNTRYLQPIFGRAPKYSRTRCTEDGWLRQQCIISDRRARTRGAKRTNGNPSEMRDNNV